jgi:hypothetical protein
MSNKKWSKANGVIVCDALAENPNLTRASLLVGSVKPTKLVFAWMKASHLEEVAGIPPDKAEHGIQWPDEEWIYFHRAVIETQKRFLAVAATQVRSLLASPESGGGGHERVVVGADGKPAWTVDPKIASDAMTLDDDMWELTYGTRKRSDVFARNERGELIAFKVRDPIPSQTLIHLIRSLFPDMFDPVQRTMQDVHHSGAVLILGDQPKSAINRESTPLREDMERRLAEIRSRKEAAKPEGEVAVFKDMRTIDQPDDVADRAPRQLLAPQTIADHPRKYEVPAPPEPKPLTYGKPVKPSSGINKAGYGSSSALVPPGGFRVS